MAIVDPLFAILNRADKRGRKWNEEDFFATGEEFANIVMNRLGDLNWRTSRADRALDFGCGVGRLARPLARHFQSVVGVDFSPTMVSLARSFHQKTTNAEFRHHNTGLAPLVFADGEFDFVLSVLVLQHQASERIVEWWLKEMIHVLKPGGVLVFQLPYATAWRTRGQCRLRGYQFLRKLGVSSNLLSKLTLAPISMLSVGEGRVRRVVTEQGAGVLAVDRNDRSCGTHHPSAVYYVTRLEE